jgi:hypothetical protein
MFEYIRYVIAQAPAHAISNHTVHRTHCPHTRRAFRTHHTHAKTNLPSIHACLLASYNHALMVRCEQNEHAMCIWYGGKTRGQCISPMLRNMLRAPSQSGANLSGTHSSEFQYVKNPRSTPAPLAVATHAKPVSSETCPQVQLAIVLPPQSFATQVESIEQCLKSGTAVLQPL